jgi:predicted transcriptional regulator of viral defense system
MAERQPGLGAINGDGLRTRLSHAARAPGITAVSHHSAAYLHGLVNRPPRFVHVLALRGSHPSRRPDVIVHHTRALDPGAVVYIDGVPVTDLPSTVVMMAAYATVDETKAMIRAAIATALTLDELRAVAESRRRRGRAGPSQLLHVLSSADILRPPKRLEAPAMNCLRRTGSQP